VERTTGWPWPPLSNANGNIWNLYYGIRRDNAGGSLVSADFSYFSSRGDQACWWWWWAPPGASGVNILGTSSAHPGHILGTRAGSDLTGAVEHTEHTPGVVVVILSSQCVLGRSSVLLLIASIEETSESRRASYHGIIETVTRRIHEKNRRLEHPARASIDSRLKFLGRFSITGAFDPGLEQLAGRRSH